MLFSSCSIKSKYKSAQILSFQLMLIMKSILHKVVYVLCIYLKFKFMALIMF